MDVDDTLMQNESSEGNQTDTKLPASIEPFSEEMKYHIGKMHDQFKIRIETDNANRLAKKNPRCILPIINNEKESSSNFVPNKWSTGRFCYRITHTQQNSRNRSDHVITTVCGKNCSFNSDRNTVRVSTILYVCKRKLHSRYGWMVHSSILCMFLEVAFCKHQRKCIRLGA